MEFFNSAVDVLQTLVIALGAGLGIWGAINLLEGYGNDNPGAKSQSMKQFMRNAGEQIEYRVCGIDEYEYPENTRDCVISNLALHYIEDIELIFQKIHRTLKPDGIFLFNIEHPVFTAGVGQDWIYTDVGTPKYWPIDNYFFSGERKTHFLGCDVVKQHHTLTQIMMGLLNNSFELKVVEEAEPPQEMMDIPGFQDELRRPMMLLVKSIARKSIIKEKL